MSSTTDSETGGRRLTGRTVLVIILGFFGVIMAVNSAFVYFAISTFPGLAVESSYKAGQEYERDVADGRAQAERAWRVDGSLRPDGPGARVEISFADKTGAALTGLGVTVQLVHAVDPSHDHSGALTETRPGVYALALPDLPSGRWYMTIEASKNGARLFRSDNEVKLER